MKKSIKLAAFLTLGSIAFTVHMSLTQNYFYQELNKETLLLQKKMGLMSENDQNYFKWTKTNTEFIKSLKSETVDYKDIINDLNIYIRQNSTVWDKLSSLLLNSALQFNQEKSGDHLFYVDQLSTVEGEASYFKNSSYTDSNGNLKMVNPFLVLGTQAFNNKENEFNQKLLNAFDGNKEQGFSFVYFHEMGHYLTARLTGHEEKNEIELMQDWLEQFEIQQKIKLPETDKNIILDQYAESVGDVFSIQILLQKYPELKDKKLLLIDKLIDMRENSYGKSHLTVAALYLLKEHYQNNLNNNDKNLTLEDMLEVARTLALKNVEYFSKTPTNNSLTNSSPRVQLTKDGMTEEKAATIKKAINKLRESHKTFPQGNIDRIKDFS